MNLTASPRALDELKRASETRRQNNAPEAVRVAVRSRCGCGAAHFGMWFDSATAADNKIDLGDITLLVNVDDAALLDNAQLDYSDDLMNKGFRINAPAAGGGCGCGGHGH